MKGFLYIMSNPAYKSLLKIGQTGKDPEERRRELTTGIPDEFVIEYYAFVEDYLKLELEIHQKLNNSRYRQDREFFEISVQEAINTIRKTAGERIEFEKDFSKQKSVSNRNKLFEFLLVIILFSTILMKCSG